MKYAGFFGQVHQTQAARHDGRDKQSRLTKTPSFWITVEKQADSGSGRKMEFTCGRYFYTGEMRTQREKSERERQCVERKQRDTQ